MSDTPNNGPEELSPSLGRVVNEACNRFERDWQAGESPRVEDHLPAAAAEHAALILELIALEIFYRRRGGEKPTAAEYRTRFPDLDETRLEDILTEPPGPPVREPSDTANFPATFRRPQPRCPFVVPH